VVFPSGAPPLASFDAVLAAAGPLGVPRIWISVGATVFRGVGPEQRVAVREGARQAANRAAAVGIRSALEHHAATRTEDPDSTLALLDAVAP
jgi:hypothetical protein